MNAKFCPHCGGKLPIMVSDEDISGAVEEQSKDRPPVSTDTNSATIDNPFLSWTYTYCCNKDKANG